jgi:cell wall assembly regulator SMI1
MEATKTNYQKIDVWFQKWFHNQSGFSDVGIVQERLQKAKQDLLTIYPDEAAAEKTPKKEK